MQEGTLIKNYHKVLDKQVNTCYNTHSYETKTHTRIGVQTMTKTMTETKNSVPNLDREAPISKVYETIIDTVKGTTPDTFSNSGWEATLNGVDGIYHDEVECTLQKSSYPLGGIILYDKTDCSFYFKLNSMWVSESLYDTVSDENDSELDTTYDYINAVTKDVEKLDTDGGGKSKTIFGTMFGMDITYRGNGKRKYLNTKNDDEHDFSYRNYRIVAWGVDGNSIERKYTNQTSMMKAVNDVADFLSEQTVLFNEEADRVMFEWLNKRAERLHEKIEEHKALLKTFANIESKWEALDNAGFSSQGKLKHYPDSWFKHTYKFRKATPIGVFEVSNHIKYTLDNDNKIDRYDNLYELSLATTDRLMYRAEKGGGLDCFDFNRISEEQTLEQVLEFMSHIV